MELKTIFSNVEPSNRNVVWISTINGIVVQRVYTAKGWQVVGSPSVSEGGSTSLDEPTDKYIFKISDNPEDLAINIDTAADIGLSKTVNDLSTYIEGVELEIGDSDVVKQSNLEKLRRVTVKTNVFSTHIDYGIGVGSWTDGTGGFAHITTAQGHEAYYTISEDGAVVTDSDYVTPTSLYGEYKANGGLKTKEEFNDELFNLIG